MNKNVHHLATRTVEWNVLRVEESGSGGHGGGGGGLGGGGDGGGRDGRSAGSRRDVRVHPQAELREGLAAVGHDAGREVEVAVLPRLCGRRRDRQGLLGRNGAGGLGLLDHV